MSYNCEVKEQQAQPVFVIRARTPVQQLPQVMGEAYGKIASYLGELQQHPTGAPFAAYYNMDMNDMDVEIGFPVRAALPAKDDMYASEIPTGWVGTCIHKGPYTDSGPAYEALTQFVKDQGFKPTGIAYEFYLNDPTAVAPDAIETKIMFSLKN